MDVNLLCSVSTSGSVPVILLWHLYRIMVDPHHVDVVFRSLNLIFKPIKVWSYGLGYSGPTRSCGLHVLQSKGAWKRNAFIGHSFVKFLVLYSSFNPTPSLKLAYPLLCVLKRICWIASYIHTVSSLPSFTGRDSHNLVFWTDRWYHSLGILLNSYISA